MVQVVVTYEVAALKGSTWRLSMEAKWETIEQARKGNLCDPHTCGCGRLDCIMTTPEYEEYKKTILDLAAKQSKRKARHGN